MRAPACPPSLPCWFAVICLCLLAPAHAETVLRVVSWAGYTDPAVVKAFEQRYSVRVELTIVDSDTVLWQKINSESGAAYDVFAANTAELVRYRNAGLLQTIDAATIPNIARQLPQFRDESQLAEIFQAGKRYAVPYTFAEMGLIYDRKTFATPPDSITALWDRRFQGKVLAYDGGTHNFSLAAMKQRQANPFRIAPSQWSSLASDLIELRRNVSGFYSQLDASLRLYRERNAVLVFANYGRQQFQLFRQAGIDVGYAVPREGALAWLDCWAITRASRQPELAAKWIDLMLEPAASTNLVERQGLSSTMLADGSPANVRRLWLQPVENVERRELLWGRIVAGDRIQKVMAP